MPPASNGYAESIMFSSFFLLVFLKKRSKFLGTTVWLEKHSESAYLCQVTVSPPHIVTYTPKNIERVHVGQGGVTASPLPVVEFAKPKTSKNNKKHCQ